MKQYKPDVDYTNDVVIGESLNYVCVINSGQCRPHIFIRCQREKEKEFPKDLFDQSEDQQAEFWKIVQQVLSKISLSSSICFHFGFMATEDYFHAHIIVDRTEFGKLAVEYDKESSDYSKIVEQINEKMQFRKEHYLELKDKEVKKYGCCDESNDPIPSEWEGFNVEIDPGYTRVYFIPKEPFTYSGTQCEVVGQLFTNRRRLFNAMHTFATTFRIQAYQMWIRLFGDPLCINDKKPPSKKIEGLLFIPMKLFLKLVPSTTTWVKKYQSLPLDPLVTM